MVQQWRHFKSLTKQFSTWSFVLLLLLVMSLFACSTTDDLLQDQDSPAGPTTPGIVDEWSALMQRGAYPFTTPLPPAEPGPIDGTYVKFDPKVATPIPCRRCPDYMNEGGVWKLSFDKGTFRILHLVTGWRGIGSFTVNGDELLVFNDPKCPDLIGRYTWQMVGDGLALSTVYDHCAADMRSHNFRQMVWQRCPDAADSAQVKDQAPEGCN